MPALMAKGPILKRLDKLLNSAKRNQALNDLENSFADLVNLGSDQTTYGADRVLTKQPWVSHLRDEWFKAWWPHAQPVEPIIRQGLITALKVALAKPNTPRIGQQPLPIDSYWVCHPGHPSHPTAPGQLADGHPVEVSISWSSQQVTLIIHTPEPPYPNNYNLTDYENILVVKREQTGQIVIEQLKNQPEN